MVIMMMMMITLKAAMHNFEKEPYTLQWEQSPADTFMWQHESHATQLTHMVQSND